MIDWAARVARACALAPGRAGSAALADRLTLTIDDAPVGTISLPHAQLLRHALSPPRPRELRFDGGALRLYGDAQRVRIDRLLAAIAAALRAAGEAPHWRDELIDVFDATGRVVGAVERGVARELGVLTRSVNLVGFRGQQVWLQQRAWHKPTDPGLWDVLASGLIASGEAAAAALARETREEAGIELQPLSASIRSGRSLLVERPTPRGPLREVFAIFDVDLPAHVEPRNLDGEALGFDCLACDQLLARIAARAVADESALVLAESLSRRGLVSPVDLVGLTGAADRLLRAAPQALQ